MIRVQDSRKYEEKVVSLVKDIVSPRHMKEIEKGIHQVHATESPISEGIFRFKYHREKLIIETTLHKVSLALDFAKRIESRIQNTFIGLGQEIEIRPIL